MVYQKMLDMKYMEQRGEEGLEGKWGRFKENIMEAARLSCGVVNVSNNRMLTTEL